MSQKDRGTERQKETGLRVARPRARELTHTHPTAVLNDLHEFDTATLAWNPVNSTGGEPPSPRADLGFAAAAGVLVVFGGRGGQNLLLHTVGAYMCSWRDFLDVTGIGNETQTHDRQTGRRVPSESEPIGLITA